MVHSVTVCCRVLFKFPRKAKRICLSLCLFASIFEALLVFFFLYKAVTSKTMKKKNHSLFCATQYIVTILQVKISQWKLLYAHTIN